ncbi:MAG: C40 family peptidase [Pyrinomonadaceae bacterium]
MLTLTNDLDIPILSAPVKSPSAVFAEPTSLQFKQLLSQQINHRLGAPYVYGAAGPWYFDCSGFVWSVFQAAGVTFERTSARSLWQDFAPVKSGEEYKFGTLVFFNNLRHVGIVVDETGFYHASRSNGVTYSPFNEYWTNRLDGFRKNPRSSAHCR